MDTKYAGRWLINASFVLWALAAAVVVWWWADPLNLANSCDLSGSSSVFGEASRSWLPPGTTCTWEINGIEHIDSPSHLRTLVLTTSLLGPFVSAYLRRLLMREPSHAARVDA
jgi:hypothetical protein